MRADNKGEGGILALMSLVRPERSHPVKRMDFNCDRTFWRRSSLW